MRVNQFRCDRCGRVLEMHGERYVMRMERVPKQRIAGGRAFDLCPECAATLKIELGRKEQDG